MQPTNRLRTITIATCATLVLVLTGIRCTSATQPVPADTPKIPVYTQKRVIGRVDWPISSTINQAALKAMKPEEVVKIASSGVPVLVPSDPRYLAIGIMGSTNEVSYDFGTDGYVDGVGFSIGASRVSSQSDAPVPAYALEPTPGEPVIRGQRVSISQNEVGNWTATWGEFGEVGYLLHVGCETFDNPRCADNTFIKSLVASMVYIGGSGK